MMQLDEISRAYIRLAFELERHVDGFVDAYFGPADLRPRSELPVCMPDALVDDLVALRRQVGVLKGTPDYPARRCVYLDKQLCAMETIARKLAGEKLSYCDEVRSLFDIEPYHTSETVFEAAISDLAAVLPGSGPVAERMTRWKQQFEVMPALAQPMVDHILQEARCRTQALIDLPEGESVEFRLVHDKPWSGYNWYLGQMHSRIDINTDLPIRADTLVDLVCHEAYPGHHTEHALKEAQLYTGRGWAEHAIQLINTPECVISEGIATLAADIIFGDEAIPWAAAELYPLAGILVDPDIARQVDATGGMLRALSGNAALLLHEHGVDVEEVVRYMMRYGLRTEREARQQVRFIADPLWRAYTFTYHTGRDLLRRWMQRGDRRQRFCTLLVEQTYPSLIEQWVLEEEQPCLG